MNPLVEFAQNRTPKTDRYRIDGTPFELELQEILSGTKLVAINTQAEGRLRAAPLLKKKFGVAPSADEIGWYTWLEASCIGVWQDMSEEGERWENLQKVADKLNFDEILSIAQATRDHMIAAGMRARLLSMDDIQGNASSSSATQEAGEESCVSPAESGTDAPAASLTPAE